MKHVIQRNAEKLDDDIETVGLRKKKGNTRATSTQTSLLCRLRRSRHGFAVQSAPAPIFRQFGGGHPRIPEQCCKAPGWYSGGKDSAKH